VIATADAMLKGGVNTALDGVNTTLKEVNTTLEELRRPLATADAVLKNTDATLVGKNAPLQQELSEALQEITRAARSLRDLMNYLERHPDSLRGKDAPPRPRREPGALALVVTGCAPRPRRSSSR
jgi:paraquat-inducible protein B